MISNNNPNSGQGSKRGNRPRLQEGGRLADTRIFFCNLSRNPMAAIMDLGLSTIDKAGAPTNYMNYLRDINANRSTKIVGNVGRAVGTVLDNKIGNKNRATTWGRKAEKIWDQYNPFLITPIPVRNNNFSKEELDALARMSGNGTHNITNADVKRVSSTGHYGAEMSPKQILQQDPTQVVQTSVGQATARNGKLTDVFDVNVGDPVADGDNAKYLRMALNRLRQGKIGYSLIRGLFPYTSSISSTGTENNDKHKIKTEINFNK